ncbi:YsnF/AvaK domain-containing protein [Micromonospora cathayae]|uniref:YsnF/AvaK domain-containing protein n=1 Tax=Micromonospora cathayae TaxID=3028804 RepID=A0ABY7ZPB6_9ACTN|nr:YsnF/AvaK domain-containing protein [Micromonospora sp. HUAS 3]WDZ84072.1 YsnF/AvaK domain-containing protein [Micromonospora sp. HUAS 3]
MNLTEQQIRSLYGQDVQDRSGARIGSVGQVWADAAGEPTWVSVKTGVMGHHESMAPLTTARMQEGRLTMPYDKATVKSAPTIDAGTDEPLGADQITQLYAHYGMSQQPTPKPGPPPGGPRPGPRPGQQERRTPQDQQELVRSEERLRVGTQSEPAGTARLRKYVVTEDVHTTVPVEHDEVRVERSPVTSADAGDVRPDIGEAERELTLRRERPVVRKDQVPVERVRLARDEVVEDQPVDERVRRERIDADVPEPSRRRA